jgi:hypothetical protein
MIEENMKIPEVFANRKMFIFKSITIEDEWRKKQAKILSEKKDN